MMSAVIQTKIAGRMAYDVFYHIPGCKQIKLEHSQYNVGILKVKIEFEDVCFNYSLNLDLKVLKNFTCIFEAG